MRSNTLSSTPTAAAATAPLPVAIRLLRRLNPVIAAVLRSPVHGLLSRNLLVLTYVGKRSGRRRTLPLSYVTVRDRPYLCTRSSQWWRSWRTGTAVELRLRGRHVAAIPHVVDVATPEALDALRAFLGANPKTGVMLYGVRTEGGRPVEADLVREVRRSVVIRLDPI